MKLSIQRMVVLLSVALVLLTALALSTASIIQTNGFADGVQADLDGMTDERINQSANSVRDIVRTQGDALAQRVESDLRVTQAELDDAGGFRTGGGSVTWQAKNQATQEVTTWIAPGSVESGLCRPGGCRGAGVFSVEQVFVLDGWDVAAV